MLKKKNCQKNAIVAVCNFFPAERCTDVRAKTVYFPVLQKNLLSVIRVLINTVSHLGAKKKTRLKGFTFRAIMGDTTQHAICRGKPPFLSLQNNP